MESNRQNSTCLGVVPWLELHRCEVECGVKPSVFGMAWHVEWGRRRASAVGWLGNQLVKFNYRVYPSRVATLVGCAEGFASEGCPKVFWVTAKRKWVGLCEKTRHEYPSEYSTPHLIPLSIVACCPKLSSTIQCPIFVFCWNRKMIPTRV